nr:hypothetical protein [Candidatus Arsenophonus triatominarum]
MLALAKKRGIKPEAVAMDAWYSSLDNLKLIRSHGWVWVTTLTRVSHRHIKFQKWLKSNG